MAEPEGYRVPEVCKLVGISYRQLDYWARTGLVTPSIREAGGSGTQRLYSFQDLVQWRRQVHSGLHATGLGHLAEQPVGFGDDGVGMDAAGQREHGVADMDVDGGSGTQRLYSFQDLVQLRVIRKLLDTGISLHNIRKAVLYLRENVASEPSSITLMSDGVRIYACESEDEIIDLVKRGQGVFAIALDKVWDDLSDSVGRKRQPPRAAAAVARARGA